MADPRTPRDFVDRNRFGRVGRIPTPTPVPVGDIHSDRILPQAGTGSLTLITPEIVAVSDPAIWPVRSSTN